MKPVLALLIAAAPALAAASDAKPREATIAFPDQSIRNWAAGDRDTIYIETAGKRWYRGELFSPCLDLPYALGVGFVANRTGGFDRFSKIVVEGQTCQLKSLVAVPGPPPKAKKHRA